MKAYIRILEHAGDELSAEITTSSQKYFGTANADRYEILNANGIQLAHGMVHGVGAGAPLEAIQEAVERYERMMG